jgi:hypothetical protein
MNPFEKLIILLEVHMPWLEESPNREGTEKIKEAMKEARKTPFVITSESEHICTHLVDVANEEECLPRLKEAFQRHFNYDVEVLSAEFDEYGASTTISFLIRENGETISQETAYGNRSWIY